MNIYQYAKNTEESGIRFYREMAENSPSTGVRNIFTMLADDEKRLMEKLELMHERFPEMDQKNCRFLRNRDNVFEKMREREESLHVENNVEAYRLARDTERKVMRKYMKAAAAEKSADTRKYLEWLVALEQSELSEIEKIFDFVDAPNHFLEWGEFSNLDEFHNFGRYVDR